MQLVWTTICYVNRSFLATAVSQFLIVMHNPGLEGSARLDRAVGDRCVALTQQPDMIRASTLFH